jgi:hypothetical protein
MSTNFGFIMTRHVTNKMTDQYWLECYRCIRVFYPDIMIVIIDDSSDYRYVSDQMSNGKIMTNIIVIQSKYKKKGELLPYVYFYKYKWFDKAVIIHDSIFIHQYISFDNIENQVLWDFDNDVCSLENEQLYLLNQCNNPSELLEIYQKKKWRGCYGVMSIITINFITSVNKNFGLRNILKSINTRQDRMCLERVMGVIFYWYNNETKPSIFGDILKYSKWEYSYNDYERDKSLDRIQIPFVKVRTGR